MLARDRNRGPFEIEPLDLGGCLLVVDPTGPLEEIDDDLIRDPDHGVATHLVVFDQLGGPIRENRRQPSFDASHVLVAGIDQQVDVLGRPDVPVQNDGETADQDETGVGFDESSTDRDEVLDSWRARLRTSIDIIHSSASSKDRNR